MSEVFRVVLASMLTYTAIRQKFESWKVLVPCHDEQAATPDTQRRHQLGFCLNRFSRHLISEVVWLEFGETVQSPVVRALVGTCFLQAKNLRSAYLDKRAPLTSHSREISSVVVHNSVGLAGRPLSCRTRRGRLQ